MKLPAASTKRTGQPRCAQRLETAMNSFGSSSEFLRAFADVGGRLAGVADPLGFGEDDLAVGVVDEVAGRADRLPALLAAVEDRGDGEADRGQDDRGAGDPAEALDGDREGVATSHRLALEVAGRLGFARSRGAASAPCLLVRFVSHCDPNEEPAEFIDWGHPRDAARRLRRCSRRSPREGPTDRRHSSGTPARPRHGAGRSR